MCMCARVQEPGCCGYGRDLCPFSLSVLRLFVDRLPQLHRTKHRGKRNCVCVRVRCSMLKPTNPCPVCGAETALTEVERHPLHVNFDIHGYLCDRCGPVKSLVVLRSWSPARLQ